jgi:hypothetical protein
MPWKNPPKSFHSVEKSFHSVEVPDFFPICVGAINARHSHASMGARCLLANLGALRAQARLAEFTLRQTAAEIADALLSSAPRILALGAYIWNARRIRELLPLLRARAPHMAIVLGGPEIVDDDLPADYFLLGEGDLAFADLCRDLLAGRAPPQRILRPAPPDLARVQMPYDEYSDSDLAHRTLYVETSRGCAMRCDYCVSANDSAVRFFPLPALLDAFERLLARGARQFKFCDRSFNHDPARAVELLSFFAERAARFPGLFVHAEMLPDRFSDALKAVLASFPPRSLQLEVGLQSFNPDVLRRIRRPQNLERAAENLRFLRDQTHAYVHADLIAGLPGETPESFAAGFDRLVALAPHEIQLGILKKLPGAPIARHDEEFEMRYSAAPPYEVLATRDWPAEHLRRTARFAHYWDAVVSSNRFLGAAPRLWQDAPSVFDAFMAYADSMGGQFASEHGTPLAALVEATFRYLAETRGQPAPDVAAALVRAYRHAGARDVPAALAPHLREPPPPPTAGLSVPLRRQALRWAWPQKSAFVPPPGSS